MSISLETKHAKVTRDPLSARNGGNECGGRTYKKRTGISRRVPLITDIDIVRIGYVAVRNGGSVLTLNCA